MRTNIVIDDELLAEAFAHSDIRTKKDLVDRALREFVDRRKRRNLMDLYGQGGLRKGYDYKALRERQAG